MLCEADSASWAHGHPKSLSQKAPTPSSSPSQISASPQPRPRVFTNVFTNATALTQVKNLYVESGKNTTQTDFPKREQCILAHNIKIHKYVTSGLVQSRLKDHQILVSLHLYLSLVFGCPERNKMSLGTQSHFSEMPSSIRIQKLSQPICWF